MPSRYKKPSLAVDRRRFANTHGNLRQHVIIIHTTECGDRDGSSDVSGVIRYLENKGYGIHFCIDKEGLVGQGAPIDKVVYHAAGANSFAIGIELIGYARFSLKDWNKRKRQLRKLAIMLAWIHRRTGIPLKRSKVNGVAYHRDFPAGGHTDPGLFFPGRRVLRMARKYAKNGWVVQ